MCNYCYSALFTPIITTQPLPPPKTVSPKVLYDVYEKCSLFFLRLGDISNFFLHFMFFRKRRGAINSKQLAFLQKYRPKSRLKLKNGHKNSCCVQ